MARDPKKEPATLKSLLESLLTKKLSAPEITYEQKIAKIWLRVVGKEIARHADPVSFRHNILVVRVSHPLWATELQYRSAGIRKKINEILDEELVSEIRFRS